MADAGLPWSIPNAGFSIQPINGEFAAWSRGSSVPPDGWSVLSGTWSSTLSRCQGGTGPYAVDFGQAGIPSTLVSDYIVVLPNTRYLLSALYRIVTGSGAALSQGVRVDWYDDARALISSTNLDLVAGTFGSWTYLGVDTTSPIQAVYAKVVAGRFNVNGSTDLQIDAIKLDRAVYIPSGVISLDDVTDGVTYARPRGAYMSGGIINAVVRGAGTVATDFLFKKPNISDPDTLDAVPNGATYGRPKLDALTVAGYPDLDKVVDGANFRKVGTAYVDVSNRIIGVLRGTSPVAGADLFAKTLDNLSNIADGGGFRRTADTYVDSSGRVTGVLRGTSQLTGSDLFSKALDNLGNIQDGGGFRRTADTYVDTSGRVTGVLRGTSQLTGSDLFSKALDNLDNVLNGAIYGRPKLDGLNASGYPLLDKVVDGALFRRVGVGYVNASGQITAIRNTTGGGADIPGTAVFSKSVDTLDNVTDGTIFARVSATTLSGGVVQTIKYGTGTFATGSLFRKATDTLDDMAEGTTYKRLVSGAVTSGYPSSVYRDGAPLATSGLFKVNSNTLDDMAEGTTYKRLVTGAVTSGYPSSVYRDGAPLATSNLFKKSSDTFASVAGTLSDGQLGSNVVNTANVKDGNISRAKISESAVDYTKMDDGAPFMSWDEARDAFVSNRISYVNGGSVSAPEIGQGYTQIGATSGTNDFYINTDLAHSAARTRFVTLTYRIYGTGFTAVSFFRCYNMSNYGQNVTAPLYADGGWHTAVFDISAWTGTGTVRFDVQDTTTPIGASSGIWISHMATGNIGVGTGGGTNMVHVQGNVGIGVASPASRLHIRRSHNSGTSVDQFRADFDDNWGLKLTQNYVGAGDIKYEFKQVYGGTTYDVLAFNAGSVGIGTTNPLQRLQVGNGSGQEIIRVAGGSSGTNGGSGIFFGAGSINVHAIGHYSAIYGGAYNDALTIWSGGRPTYINPSGGYVGVNNVNPARELSVKGQITASPTGTSDDLAYNGQVVITKPGTASQHINMIRAGNRVWSIGFRPSSNTLLIAGGEGTDSNFGNSQPFSFTDAGNMGIGTVAPAARLHTTATNENLRMEGTDPWATFYQSGARKGWFGYGSGAGTTAWGFTNEVTNGYFLFNVNGTGNLRANYLAGTGNRAIYVDANGGFTTSSSDERLKNDVQPLENVLPVVMKMNPVSFSWKDQERFGPYTEVGFLAQEMLELVPFVIGKNADDTFTIDYPKLTAVLARAIQELKQQVDELANSRS